MVIGGIGQVHWMELAKHLCLLASILYVVKNSFDIQLQSISTVTAVFYYSCYRNIAPTAPMMTAFSKTMLVSVCNRSYEQMQNVENHFFGYYKRILSRPI